MLPTTPTPEAFRTPEGTITTIVAKNQPEYLPLPALITPDGRVVTSWQPSSTDLARLLGGEPLTIVIHTFRTPLQPLQVFIGGADLR